jgi:collagenase-like PrtC family protease
MRSLELLAPAKDLACGLAAIDQGADAVYIGAAHHGARASATNSVDDIAELCRYAHRFSAKVYVTVNTLVYDEELEATRALVGELDAAGVDGLLVQDMALLQLPHRAALHASTQCDTRTAAKASWLKSLGFKRVVLARELSLQEISDIHRQEPDLELEVFVHGALCVSYSGVCYASQYCFQRSANRGACAQFCRMEFDLLDADGRTWEHNRHLLSLKDMCLIDHLEQLADAGAVSFKIEGRLKDADYVKNVVAAYSKALDRLVARRPQDYRRASLGRVEYHFEPNLNKTFNRGFTTYFLNGRQPDIASFDTPKALGEYVGRVKELRRDSFNVAGTATFANGDGLCFFAPVSQEGSPSQPGHPSGKELIGFRVNRAVGNRLYPYKFPKELKPGMALYRNHDMDFEKTLSCVTAVRLLPLTLTFGLTPKGFRLVANGVETTVDFDHQQARKPQTDNIQTQLLKLGGTAYHCDHVTIEDQADQYFIPSSLLATLRRDAISRLEQREAASQAAPVATTPSAEEGQAASRPQPVECWQPEYQRFPYLYNIANRDAKAFYEAHGLSNPRPAYEVDRSEEKFHGTDGTPGSLIMQCRHCIRYALGYCVKHGGKRPLWHEPLRLRLGDGRTFRLEFKCDECQMNIYSE